MKPNQRKQKKDWSLLALITELVQQNKPQFLVNTALVFIALFDVGLTLVNALHRLLVWVGLASAAPALPPRFSPTSPPSFAHWPVTHIYCRIIHVYNLCTNYNEDLRLHHELYSRKPRNDWIRDWAYWNGAGHQGQWSAAKPASDTDSRSPCPGLNTLATHGIIHNSGQKIAASKMVAGLSRAFGIAPTMAMQLYSPLFATFADNKHIFDLEEVGIMNLIEHDASLLRPDFHLADWKEDSQAMNRPHQDLIDRYLPLSGKGGSHKKKQLTHKDFAKALRARRIECRHANKMYSSSVVQSLIGSGSCCLMLNVFDGRVHDLREMAGSVHDELPGLRTTQSGHQYGYERIPTTYQNGWQPATARRYFGMTILEALYTTFKIEMRARA